MRKLGNQDIDSKYRKKVTIQSYGKKALIDQVELIDIKNFTSEDGYFLELGRLDNKGNLLQFPNFKVEQISFSHLSPGGIKGWHVHYNQEDLWFIPPQDTVLVGLYDLRKKSATKGILMRLILGNHKSQLLLIPRGVAHGVSNISPKPINMFYFVNQKFSLEDPDERRLPWDFFGKDFWQIQKG